MTGGGLPAGYWSPPPPRLWPRRPTATLGSIIRMAGWPPGRVRRIQTVSSSWHWPGVPPRLTVARPGIGRCVMTIRERRTTARTPPENRCCSYGLTGTLLSRLAHRRLTGVLLNPPPRNTRRAGAPSGPSPFATPPAGDRAHRRARPRVAPDYLPAISDHSAKRQQSTQAYQLAVRPCSHRDVPAPRTAFAIKIDSWNSKPIVSSFACNSAAVLRKSLRVANQPQEEIVRLDEQRRVGRELVYQFLEQGASPPAPPIQRTEIRVSESGDDSGTPATARTPRENRRSSAGRTGRG